MLVLPGVVEREPLPLPLWVMMLAGIAQSGVLLALAAWAGAALAPKVGLHASVFEAIAASRPAAPALRRQVVPGLLWGLLAGVFLSILGWLTPPALAAAQARFNPPLLARVLYGGLTEELLLRWGIMTMLVWAAWRFIQSRPGAPRPGFVWAAIGLSALVFGAGHLPAAASLVGTLSGEIVGYVVGANTAFGIVFGYLFWRYGLEAAMMAHAGAHVVAYIVALL